MQLKASKLITPTRDKEIYAAATKLAQDAVMGTYMLVGDFQESKLLFQHFSKVVEVTMQDCVADWELEEDEIDPQEAEIAAFVKESL